MMGAMMYVTATSLFGALLPAPNLPRPDTANALETAIAFMFQLAAVLSLIYVIVSAVRFTTSAGDPAKVAQARQTLIYSLVGLAVSVSAFAITAIIQAQAGKAAGAANPFFGEGGLVTVVVDMLGYVVGVASVIMLIVGAIRFVTSAGQPQSAQAARNTVIYSLIGIVVALAANAIVSFILEKL